MRQLAFDFRMPEISSWMESQLMKLHFPLTLSTTNVSYCNLELPLFDLNYQITSIVCSENLVDGELELSI